MIKVGDKVRTHEIWNSHREPIEGTVVARVIEKSIKTEDVPHPNGFISHRFIIGEYDYTEHLVLDNGIKIHESNLEKVE